VLRLLVGGQTKGRRRRRGVEEEQKAAATAAAVGGRRDERKEEGPARDKQETKQTRGRRSIDPDRSLFFFVFFLGCFLSWRWICP